MSPEDDIPDFEEYDDEEPVTLDWLRRQSLSTLPEDTILWVLDNNFPECRIWREGSRLAIQIEEHIYTKYWWHKFHGAVFAEALIRAVKRLQQEGYPLRDPELESQDDEVHLFVRWILEIGADVVPDGVISAIEQSFDIVWRRANSILEDSDSVLILGKDTGEAIETLKRIESHLQGKGYHTYIIREQPDRLGESIVQKVLRYALSSKFIVVENSGPSGHLYEIPHVTKLAECVTAILQREGEGATWMFEDAYFKHHHMRKFTYPPANLEVSLTDAVNWAEQFCREFAAAQKEALPWLKGQ